MPLQEAPRSHQRTTRRDDAAAEQGGASGKLAPLFDLRAIRERCIAELYLDLQVPRWGGKGHDGREVPEIWVRYGPMDPTKVSTSAERRQRSNVKEWAVLANADALAHACVGVYAKLGDKRYSLRPGDPDGQWTRFDKDLAAALGLDPEHSKAADVVRALYLTAGDLISAANQVAAWSAAALPEDDAEPTDGE